MNSLSELVGKFLDKWRSGERSHYGDSFPTQGKYLAGMYDKDIERAYKTGFYDGFYVLQEKQIEVATAKLESPAATKDPWEVYKK